jgi:hypothetical protein
MSRSLAPLRQQPRDRPVVELPPLVGVGAVGQEAQSTEKGEPDGSARVGTRICHVDSFAPKAQLGPQPQGCWGMLLTARLRGTTFEAPTVEDGSGSTGLSATSGSRAHEGPGA